MAKKTIDFTNKSASAAAQDINDNFTELYAGQGGGSGSGISLPYNLVVLGDSIATEGSGHWFNAMKTKFGITNAHDFAVSGSTWRHREDNGVESKYNIELFPYQGWTPPPETDKIVTNQVYYLIDKVENNEVEVPDIVLIHCGINDSIMNLGTPADVFNYQSVPTSSYLANWDVENETYTNTAIMKTTAGGMRFALDLLRTNFPYARIVLTTPIYRSLQSQQTVVRQLNALIKDCASYMGLPVIDLGYESGIFTDNVSEYLADGLHPNHRGGKVLADIIGSRLCAMFGFKPMFDYSTNEAPT